MNSFLSFHFLKGITLLLASSLVALTACQTKSPEPGNTANTNTASMGQDGYVVGKVTDSQGKPLPRATVFIDHAVFSGDGPEVKTAADGTYRVQMTDIAGEWIAKSYLLKQYNDRIYKLWLDPENDAPFTAHEKPVRNFRWKLTGHMPDLSLDLYYGGTLELFRDLNANGLYDEENVELTLTPSGPLIDGSTGKVLTLQAKRGTYGIIKDIPIGRYTITAVYKPTGEPLRVCNAWDGENFDYRSSVTLDFVGNESATRFNQMGLGFTNR
ncbi:carboxypeptidase-like regulatory domain-containing protein [Spirosoma radiotolerans]|uniref:Carboxypeptidase regulatory-like domain-containing protein n=1 Tax=Spirosoma radiotolerans TaxID=1379870 RepID=A0A0E3V5D6_9BACT|nr:carboxypeptidase-like regulatory domain-containing protein [Spirosoma radiotolerans]AKD54062.1 hypothetical protein SD10_03225 [Spirosoma radiotolerans]